MYTWTHSYLNLSSTVVQYIGDHIHQYILLNTKQYEWGKISLLSQWSEGHTSHNALEWSGRWTACCFFLKLGWSGPLGLWVLCSVHTWPTVRKVIRGKQGKQSVAPLWLCAAPMTEAKAMACGSLKDYSKGPHTEQEWSSLILLTFQNTTARGKTQFSYHLRGLPSFPRPYCMLSCMLAQNRLWTAWCFWF